MQQVAIEEFFSLAGKYPVLDVRSPGEYNHAHIPGAHNLPLFSDEERKTVGTIYKQESRDKAVKAGLDFFGVKMRLMVEETEQFVRSWSQKSDPKQDVAAQEFADNSVLVHCWRGGMRSAAVAWLLDTYGFKVYLLIGGYKAFRNHVLQQFDRSYSFNVLGGYTGSGKTGLLKELAMRGNAVVDLEGIACHKGSAFGGLGEKKQPSAEQFENEVGLALYRIVVGRGDNEPIWIEDESRRIGDINLPGGLWDNIRRSPVYFLEVPFEERLDHIVKGYGSFSTEELLRSIVRIKKRLGGLATKNAIGYLVDNDHKECFRILLKYYDKYYEQDITERSKLTSEIYRIPCTSADAKNNISNLVNKQTPA